MGIMLPLLLSMATCAVLLGAWVLIVRLAGRSFYPRFDLINRTLPGHNCGACGFTECLDYAKSVALGESGPLRCVPGGANTGHAIADVLQTTVEVPEPVIATVHCKGGASEVREAADYRGIQDCHAAMLLCNDVKACIEGCLGYGTCVRACPFGALSINSNHIAVVDRHKCTGCGLCVNSCPRSLLKLIPHVHKIYLACSNHESGEPVLASCSVGCTACSACKDATPSGAIAMENNLPVLDYGMPGENFVTAGFACPSHCFVDLVKVRPKANIDTKCDGCGECVPACPVAGTISGVQGARHVVKKERCIGCGRCIGTCHVRAISMWGSLGYGER